MVGAPVHPHGVQIRPYMGCTGATYPIRDPISRVRSCCRTRTRPYHRISNESKDGGRRRPVYTYCAVGLDFR